MRNHVRVAVAIAALILAEAAVSLFANDHSSRFDAADLFDLELATDPQISPDGGKIVYVRQFSDIMSDTKFSNLWIIDFDGSDHRPLTSGNYHDSSPRWSADGKQLIYISDRDDSPQIYKMWLSSGQDAKLTNLQNPPAGLAWSPDGKYISFTMLVPDSPYKLADLPTPPKGAEWAEPAKIIDKLTYRWDRVGYIKPGYTQLFVIPSEGGTPRQISSGDYYHGGFGFFGGEAVWTPDSKFLIMSANRKPDFEHDPLDSEVYEFALGDGSVRALTARKGPDNSPVVSPDGKWIVYTGFDDRYRGYQVTRLYVMNRDGSNSRVFT
ncbi:MAG TPA: DPP IV N-terminal domain-containing protein, partial [bacterium]